MRTPAKLGLYAALLVAVFAAAFVVAGVVVPEETAQSWADETNDHTADHEVDTAHAGHDIGGLGVEQHGYQLREVSAPETVGAPGRLSFTVTGPDGAAVTEYETAHERDMHVIVVRTDGAGFRHVHPKLDGDGTWSIPWAWEQAGAYRVYADFVPAATGEPLTLSSTVHAAGDVTVAPEPVESTSATVEDMQVTLDGALTAGDESTLQFTVTRDGRAVTVQPYLGADGHLVALRRGDLGYLHLHPMSESGTGNSESAPQIEFAATAPTAGTYLLYLDFRVDGQVHTAEFVVDADRPEMNSSAPSDEHSEPSERPEPGQHREGNSHDHGE